MEFKDSIRILAPALAQAAGKDQEFIAGLLTPPKDLEHGDIAFPCFALAKEWKLAPPQCAEKLKQELKLPEQFERCEIVGPYLNFFIRRSALAQGVIQRFLGSSKAVGLDSQGKKKLIVEYSSPNIAKPFHIGHLRTTLIGHSLDRIMRALGHEVISVNHLGDWGTQFGFVYAGCALFGRPTKGTIFDLVGLYIRASNLRKQQDEKTVPPEDADKPDVNTMARDYFLRLEADDKEAVEFWQWCLDISLAYLNDLYARLGVKFDHYTGESFYRKKLEGVEKMLQTSGILEDSRGALGVDLGKQLGFVRVFTEDGRSLYITRDLATAVYRYDTYNPDKILYVVGAPQNQYFKQLIAIFQRMKHPVGNRMVHVSYGNVPGISTRNAGKDDKIWLHALLDEAHDRALEAYRNQVERKPEGIEKDSKGETDLAEAVGLGAVFFNYLCRSNIKEFHFSWEEALSFQGDTGPYVQYAIARLNSMESKAKEEGLSASANCNTSLLVEDEAHRIASLLSKFQDTVEKSARDCEPYHVALFVLELAKSVASAYRTLRVVGADKPVAEARLSLFMAARQVLRAGVELIGVPVVQRM